MASLVDIHVENVQPGSLVFPSSSARESGNGNYGVGMGNNSWLKDSEIFPAILVDPIKGTLLTPIGLKSIGRYSLVSVMK